MQIFNFECFFFRKNIFEIFFFAYKKKTLETFLFKSTTANGKKKFNKDLNERMRKIFFTVLRTVWPVFCFCLNVASIANWWFNLVFFLFPCCYCQSYYKDKWMDGWIDTQIIQVWNMCVRQPSNHHPYPPTHTWMKSSKRDRSIDWLIDWFCCCWFY